MNTVKQPLFLSLALSFIFMIKSTLLNATDLQWQSSTHQNTLVELYTSEGCSSCPIADQWLSRWVNRDELWKEIIPIAFHVDYWDDLGWPDKLPSHSFHKDKKPINVKDIAAPSTPLNLS